MFSRLKHTLRKREDLVKPRVDESDNANLNSLFTFHSLPSKTLHSPVLQRPPERAKSVHYLRASSVKLDNSLLDWVYDRHQPNQLPLPPPTRKEKEGAEKLRDTSTPRRRRKRRSSFPPAIFDPTTQNSSQPKEGLLYIRVLEVRSYHSRKDYNLRCVLRVGAKECSTATVNAMKRDPVVQVSTFDEIFLYDVSSAFTLYISVFGQRVRKSSRRSSFFSKGFHKLTHHDKPDVVVGSLQLSFPLQRQEKSVDTYFLDRETQSDSKKVEIVLEVGMQFLETKEADSGSGLGSGSVLGPISGSGSGSASCLDSDSDSDSDETSKSHLHFGHLQLLVRETTGSTSDNWESYFVALRNNKLTLYHPRHKSAKPPVHEFDLSGMSSVRGHNQTQPQPQPPHGPKKHVFELIFPATAICTDALPPSMLRDSDSEYKLYLSAPTESTRNIWLEQVSDLLEDPTLPHQHSTTIHPKYLW
ncbi:hypothetical protein K493DRAFT_313106 [Basidiobolus meristosporus CBS 931.73]|uniref:PH domain-containing protein n=1 Tax=Basidiobolus meristosporus CBS 931.73 TaxID=1314790 RepID=A0A1Y1YPG9_9FUNG|nr:hypothetical protein K493DRAFT_313106 [Basidiobolus meristosporus CBS 931.73]|eukprot:ORX99723.1 hypothetical protein K493DRAFT_313106 [Basidiobolus meristosporus CBS 931.73]